MANPPAIQSLPISYFVDAQPPTPWTRALTGYLTVTDHGLIIDGPIPINLHLNQIKTLGSFRANTVGSWGTAIHCPQQTIYFHPALVTTLFGHLTIVRDHLIGPVYTILHNHFGGPGICAACQFDMRAFRAPCPECGHDFGPPSARPTP
jgi:hypothetical protein